MNEEFEGRKRLFEWYDKKATLSEEQLREADAAGRDDEEVFDKNDETTLSTYIYTRIRVLCRGVQAATSQPVQTYRYMDLMW